MKNPDRYLGGKDPFEGDRTLWLRSLPEDTRVKKARVILKAAAPADGRLFEEVITFPPGKPQSDRWGATIARESSTVEVDFHARRTMARVKGSGGDSTLEIDMGGVYVTVAQDGTFNPDVGPLPVDLSDTEVPLPGLATSKFKLTGSSLDISQVTVLSVPTNVSVRLGDLPPFWTHLGELATAQTSPDFSAVLNAFLAEVSAENGFYAIPFVIHSDTIARLDVTLHLDYVIEQAVLPPYLPEVTLPYGYSGLPGVEDRLLTVDLPRGAAIASTGGAVMGAFDASRVVSPEEVGKYEATAWVTVTPGRSLAQPIQLIAETPADGIDLPLANTEPGLAGLHLALQADADGKPSGEVLIKADVKVEKPVPGGSAWGSAALPAEFRFEKGKRYWLVLQSVSGEAQWDVEPGAPAVSALQASLDGGFSWRIAATDEGAKPLAAIFRLRYTPERFTLPVQLEVGEGPHAKRVKFDRFAPLGRVEFDLDFASELEAYLSSPSAVSPCGSGNLLVNGGFDQPPHDDATFRLFGFHRAEDTGGRTASDSASVEGVTGLDPILDLSVERFIRLSIDDHDPVRIDCAGAVPALTRPDEVVVAISGAVGHLADVSYDNVLIITSRTNGSGSAVQLHPWCRPEVPEGWQGIPGQVLHVKQEEVEGLCTVLLAMDASDLEGSVLGEACFFDAPTALQALTGSPAELAQRVPVGAECSYLLSVRFAGVTPYMPAPRWQIEWLDAEDLSLGADEGALEAYTELGFDNLHECQFSVMAPTRATQANVRFIQPPPGYVLLVEVSFSPTLETVENGGFRFWVEQEIAGHSQALPEGWQVASGWALPPYVAKLPLLGGLVVAKATDGKHALPGGVVVGLGPRGQTLSTDSVLQQRVNVLAGRHYQLGVRAWSMEAPADDSGTLPWQQHARLEMRWLANEDEIGESVILPLDGRDFPTHAWSGNAPGGATQAEIRLIQPQGRRSLVVQSVSLLRSDLVSVPLTFLAEAPGELSVSDLRVAYKPATEAEEGLGVQRKEPAAEAGMPVAEVRSMEAQGPTRLAAQPVGIIAGVGTATEGSLAAAGIITVGDLAALDLAQTVNGIDPARLLEARTRAELTLTIRVPPDAFPMMAAESLETLLALPPAELAQRAGQRRGLAEQLQRDLRALGLLLKNDAFRSLHVSDLLWQG